jgi:predicted Fe-Mo cluster-binding NifX family protein
MKVAIATDGQSVSQHFGHCEGFTIYDCTEESMTNPMVVQKKEFIPNPGHQPGFLPNFLNERGVKVIVAGGMGEGAVRIFNEKEIEVITGAFGKVDVIIDEYVSGKLKPAGRICHEHQHSDSCDGH